MTGLKEMVGLAVSRLTESRKDLTPAGPQSPASLPSVRQTPEEFARAIVALVALKRTANLTEAQVEAWYAVLGDFPAEVLNAAVIEMALTKERFPEVGDLYAICRRTLPKPYAAHGTGEETERPSKSEIRAVAKRLGLEVK